MSAIENHHGHPETLEGQLVQVANLISNARPGASKENLDNYVKRLVELENMCSGFEGVKKSFAVQAGTEVRVFVNPDEIDDLEMVKLAHSVTRKIESDLQHPGPIKVHVIRELRAEEFAT